MLSHKGRHILTALRSAGANADLQFPRDSPASCLFLQARGYIPSFGILLPLASTSLCCLLNVCVNNFPTVAA